MKQKLKWILYRIKRRIDTWTCTDNFKDKYKDEEEGNDGRDNNSES